MIITNPHADSRKNQTTTLQHGVFGNDFPDIFGPWAIFNHPFQNPSEQFLNYTWNQYWVTRFFLFNICYPFFKPLPVLISGQPAWGIPTINHPSAVEILSPNPNPVEHQRSSDHDGLWPIPPGMTQCGLQETPNVAPTLVFSLNSFECCFHNSSCFGWWNLCFETSWKHVDPFFLFRTHFISWRSTSEGFSFPADFPLNQPRAVGRVDVKEETQRYWKLVVAF